MKRQPMGSILGPCFKGMDDIPPDPQECAREVMARVPQTRQRSRWWPFPAFESPRMPAFPGRELAPAPIPATNGHAPARGFTMFSAVKFIAASVVVALFGGFLLAGVLTIQQPDKPMPAAGTGGATEMPTTCPPGSTPDQPGPIDQPRPLDGKSLVSAIAAAVFDRRAGTIVYLVEAYGDRETWLFDVCTNTWSLAQRGEIPDVLPANAVYDPGAGLTLVVSDGITWAYDSPTNRWTRRDAIVPEEGLTRLAYDAAAGRVIAGSMEAPYPLWAYDAEADAWQPVTPTTPGDEDAFAANRMLTYDRTVDRLLAYDVGSVELFDEESGTWEPTESKSPVVIAGGWLSWGGEITYDEAVGRTVLVGNDAVIAYDAAGDAWETLSLSPDALAISMHHKAIYDPINERIVVMGGEFVAPEVSEVSWVGRDDVWAFDARTREWIELLPSLSGQLH